MKPEELQHRLEWFKTICPQVYMAEHVGMDRSFISDLENGKKEICLRNLQVIATAFDMTLSQLLARI